MRRNALRGDRQVAFVLAIAISSYGLHRFVPAVADAVAQSAELAVVILGTLTQAYGAFLAFAIALALFEIQWARDHRRHSYERYLQSVGELTAASRNLPAADASLHQSMERLLDLATRTPPSEVATLVMDDEYKDVLESAATLLFDRLATSPTGPPTYDLLRAVAALEEFEAAASGIGFLMIEAMAGGIPVTALSRVALLFVVGLIAMPVVGGVPAHTAPGLGFAVIAGLLAAVVANVTELIVWVHSAYREVVADWVEEA